MPNGDPDFATTKLPEFERFFAGFGDVLVEFVVAHGLFLDKYYHQFPMWSLRFSHPKGGCATIDVEKPDGKDGVVDISAGWWIDDYDTFTRSIKDASRGELPIEDHTALRAAIDGLFGECLSWEPGEWTRVVPGYKSAWGMYSKEEFEAFGPHHPLPNSPNYTLTGQVLDAESKSPVAGATVHAYEVCGCCRREAKTDAEGRFSVVVFHRETVKNVTFYVYADGYEIERDSDAEILLRPKSEGGEPD